MTSPPTQITVRCPSCGEEFETYHRPSWNRDLDPIFDEELAAITSAACPACGTVVALDTLVVAGDTWDGGDGASGTDNRRDGGTNMEMKTGSGDPIIAILDAVEAGRPYDHVEIDPEDRPKVMFLGFLALAAERGMLAEEGESP